MREWPEQDGEIRERPGTGWSVLASSLPAYGRTGQRVRPRRVPASAYRLPGKMGQAPDLTLTR